MTPDEKILVVLAWVAVLCFWLGVYDLSPGFSPGLLLGELFAIVRTS